MPVQTSYSVQTMGAEPGRLSDTSLYNVDGSTAASVAITPGKFVYRVSVAQDGQGTVVGQVASAGNVADVMGVAMHSHYQNFNGPYAVGMAVNVVTKGRIWALFTGATEPAARSAVSVGTDGNAATTGTALAGAVFTGAYFAGVVTFNNETVNIAEVELHDDLSAAAGA